jgi:hypothetical protein
MFYEYKVVAPPRRAARFNDLARGEDPFHRTLAETLTALGLDGWSYVGVERLPQLRRRWLFWTREDTVDVMVFRRELRPLLNAGEQERAAAPSVPNRGTDAARTSVEPHPIEAVRARRVTRPDAVDRIARRARSSTMQRQDIAAE